ncbi:hypothetical protein CPB86DRAFT_705260 [Serendipita vermifera]|nr:hypothetical protein CPB86DRAFT_705260 [Serendipita vermifera]
MCIQNTEELIINDNFLKAIWEDIGAISYPPDHTDLPPHKLGLVSEGNLKAAQWPNICIALLPSLTKEWSRYPKPSNQHEWLKNFYHLIGLTRLLFLHSVTHTDVAKFKQHSLEYIKGLQSLFNSHHMKPNHHYLLHLGDMMEMYGPMRSWWSFPYERLNGEIRKTQINDIAGMSQVQTIQ